MRVLQGCRRTAAAHAAALAARAVPAGLAVTLLAFALAAAPARAAKTCGEPGAAWERATPAEAGMDAAKLQDALDYGTSQLGFALRVYRHGCLVGEDRAAAVNRGQQFESWSMAKSVVSLMFGRAMALGLISPDDPVGSLVPEADAAHGALTMRNLLTMTSGLKWNGVRDYDIFTMPDRVRDALTLEPVHEPGTYFEYAQSPVALLAEAIGRAAGMDAGAFAQRELMDKLGIAAADWRWVRDPAGHIQGFYGVNMRPDDFGRLGDLMRRGGVWDGHRLLSRTYLRDALAPSAANGCYGWLIWLNAGAPCISPTVSERPVSQTREFPDLPADLYEFSGLFGQLVTVMPSQDIVVVRMGQDPSLAFAGGSDWEHELYRRVLGAVTDQSLDVPGPATSTDPNAKSADYGFQSALLEPDEYSKGAVQDPLPAAGPARARAAQLWLAHPRVGRKGDVGVRVRCPAACTGTARLEGAPRPVKYALAAGQARTVRLRLSAKRLRALRRAGAQTLTAVAVSADAAGGTRASAPLAVKG